MERAQNIAGMTLGELAQRTGIRLPKRLVRHKGQIGECVEKVLGADAASRPIPDFSLIGVELKTIPLNEAGVPRESTYVCRLNPADLPGTRWPTSVVKKKLARVLWIPIEATPSVPLAERRIGHAVMWSPSLEQEETLRQDWQELTDLVVTGRFDLIDARMGTALQLRPKAASGRSLMRSNDASGEADETLPRGFYLRTSFTRAILSARHPS